MAWRGVKWSKSAWFGGAWWLFATADDYLRSSRLVVTYVGYLWAAWGEGHEVYLLLLYSSHRSGFKW
jgi:hypothetical protein